MNTKMRKLFPVLLVLALAFSLSACSKDGSESKPEPSASFSGNSESNSPAPPDTTTPPAKSEETATPDTQAQEDGEEKMDIKIKITVGDQELIATLEDNATTQALLERLPLTLPMLDLYSREMCYRFPDELPADEAQTTGYEVGEIIYWPPGHSFVIMYAQNDERFNMQKIGRIDSGVEIFEETGDVEVTVELLEE
ncbi:MAG: cyclophilin-like fold protein [Peptococcaceae bacterium]